MLPYFTHHIFIAARLMRNQAAAAVFYAAAYIRKITTAFITQKIERTIAKQTVKFIFAKVMAWEECAVFVFEKFVAVWHDEVSSYFKYLSIQSVISFSLRVL